MSKYIIQAAQGYNLGFDGPELALKNAEAADRTFPPVKISGPQGEMSLAELRRLVEKTKKSA